VFAYVGVIQNLKDLKLIAHARNSRVVFGWQAIRVQSKETRESVFTGFIHAPPQDLKRDPKDLKDLTTRLKG
jgi:hypothetical protein